MVLGFLITIFLINLLYIIFLTLILMKIEKLIEKVLVILKAQNFYEAKELLEEKKEEEKIETELSPEEIDPETYLKLIQKENEKLTL